jgi:hypothetical protein
MDDVEEVWNFTLRHSAVQPKSMIIWAHSEGGLNVARLISARRINPLGVIFVGVGTESPAGAFQWSVVDRYEEHLMRWDNDGDGRVIQAEIDDRYPTDYLFPAVGITPQMLTPPSTGWMITTA